jgi:HK97 family phage major capsid protein
MTNAQIRADLEGKLQAAESESRAILARAELEHREPTPEEEKRFETLVSEGARFRHGLEVLARYEAAQPEWTAVRTRLGLTDDSSGLPPGSPAHPADPIRDLIESGERRADFVFPTAVETRAALHRVGMDETRAIADFSDSAALYVSDFSTRVAVYSRTFTPWLALANVIVSTNGRPLVIPDLTGDGTAFSPGEGTAITESTPALGTATATPASYKALSFLSAEALEDTEVNLTDVIARNHARVIGLDFGSAATTAILAAINNGGTATGLGGGGTAAFVGYEDLLDLKYSRAAPYRDAGVWVMSNGMIKKARKFTDKNGSYLWGPMASGQPGGLDGQAVYEDPYLAAPASATKSVLYGAWTEAITVKATAIRVEVSRDARFANDQIAIKSVQRIGLAVPLADAGAFLVSANS